MLYAGTWSHLAVVRSGSTVQLRVNDMVVATGSLSWSLSTAAAPVRLGTRHSISSPLGGLIDEVRITATHRLPAPHAADSSRHGNTGTVSGGATTGPAPGGPSGLALRVGGSEGGVEVPASPSLFLGDGDFRVEAWVCRDAGDVGYPPGGPIVSGPGYVLGLSNNSMGYPFLCVWGNSGSCTLTGGYASVGMWTHLVAERTGTTVRLVVNGMEAGSSSFTESVSPTPTPVRIGCPDFLWGRYRGLIDEVRIAAMNALPPNPVTADASGNGHGGTLVGGARLVPRGTSDGALRLGDSGAAVEAANPSTLAPAGCDFEIAALVCPNPTGYISGGILSGPGYQLFASGGWVYFSFWGGDGMTHSLYGGSLYGGMWSSILLQRTGETVRLLVNGMEAASTAFSGSLSTAAAPVRIGATGPSDASFPGQIDDVRIAIADPYVPAPPTSPDASGNANDATLTGAARVDPMGHMGNALRLDSSNQYAEVTPSASLLLGANDFTIDAWVQPGWYTCIYLVTAPGLNLDVDQDGRIQCYLWNEVTYYWPPLTSNGTLCPWMWNQVTLTRTGGEIALLLNGMLDSTFQFSGTLSATPSGVTMGAFWPSYNYEYACYGYGPVQVDEVSISVTTPPPPIPADTLHASIYIPQNPDPEVADTIHYFHGLRDATAADPAFSESDTEPSSLVFRGTFQDVDTTIAMHPGSFTGLTAAVDTFEATIAHTYGDGSRMVVSGTFLETGPLTSTFRATFQGANGGGGGLITQSAVSVENRAGSGPADFSPAMVRVCGLHGSQNLRSYRIDLNNSGVGAELNMKDDGNVYLKGPSRAVVFVQKYRDGSRRVFGYVMKDGEIIPMQAEVSDDAKATLKATIKTATGLTIAEGDIAMIQIDMVMDTDNDKRVGKGDQCVDFVRIGLWDGAFSTYTGDRWNRVKEEENFVGSDSRRFYFRIKDPGANRKRQGTDVIKMSWSTTQDEERKSLALTLYEVDENGAVAPDTGNFVSRAVMLVADKDDRDEPTNTGLGNLGLGMPDKIANFGDDDHRLRYAEIQSTVNAEYTVESARVKGGWPPLLRRWNVPVFDPKGGDQGEKEVAIQIFVFRCGPNRQPLPDADIGKAVNLTRSIYERIGIRVRTMGVHGLKGVVDPRTIEGAEVNFVDPPKGLDPYKVCPKRDGETIVKAFQAYFCSAPRSTPARPLRAPRIFIVGGLVDEQGDPDAPGAAWTDADNPKADEFTRGLILLDGSTLWRLNAMAHELGHVLGNKPKSRHGGHFAEEAGQTRRVFMCNIMTSRAATNDTGPGSPKRIWDNPDGNEWNWCLEMRRSAYLGR